jgi:Leucine-rich repeat (LRR) protein
MMTGLQALSLCQNSFSGALPSAWDSLTNLRTLDLCGNWLDGTIPDWPDMATNMTYLSLCNNQFSDNVASASFWTGTAWTALLALDLGNNRLSGMLPAGLVTTFPALEELNLQRNDLSGSLPLEWSAWGTLELFNMADNYMSGVIDVVVSSMMDASLKFLDMSRNAGLSGALPSVASPTHTGVKEIRLSENWFNSTLPASYGEYTALRVLDLGKNRLTGEIPSSWFSSLSELEILSIGFNLLTGTLPSSINGMTALQMLELS